MSFKKNGIYEIFLWLEGRVHLPLQQILTGSVPTPGSVKNKIQV